MLRTFAVIGLLLAGSGFATVHAGPLEFYANRASEQQHATTTSEVLPSSQLFWQQVDHNDPGAGGFLQRYYIDHTYAQSTDSPVFFYICGESTCKPSALNGAIKEYAKHYHAIMVALEHRYYGKSLPRPSFSAEDLKYLTVKQALADLHHFSTYLREVNQLRGPWITFGGSYPGALSAFYRLQYPNDVQGALASSAPVQAEANFEAYDAHVAKVAGKTCQAKILQATDVIERRLAEPSSRDAVKAMFMSTDIADDDDFMYMVADVAAAAVQYGMRDEFCATISDDTKDAVEAYADFAQSLFDRWGMTGKQLTAAGAESVDPADYLQGFGMRPWFYQSCTEFGFWQNASSDPAQRARSTRINADYHQRLCQRLFGIEQPAATTQINETYYLPLRNQASSIYFTNGSTDPWSKLSLTSDNGNNDNPALEYDVIAGAAHCDDLHASSEHDSAALRQAREHFSRQLAQWLGAA